MCRICDLRQKEVINIIDGARLGYVEDVELDVSNGRILSVVIPGSCRFFGRFGQEADYVIPWGDIQKIGDDIILVCYDLPPRTAPQKFKLFK